MPASADLVRRNGTLQLPNKVNFRNTRRLYEDFQREFDGGVDCLDCRGISEADSSAISLLLACIILAKHRSQVLHIEGMNDQLQTLARLYGVDSLLKSS